MKVFRLKPGDASYETHMRVSFGHLGGVTAAFAGNAGTLGDVTVEDVVCAGVKMAGAGGGSV